MKNTLKNMTLEELWQLFPIILSPYNRQWIHWAQDEIKRLSGLLAAFHPIISHIGSTAIPGIQAKPIIDILVEVSTDIEWESIKDIMEVNGYICMSGSDNRISFNKGYLLPDMLKRCFISIFTEPVTMTKSFSAIT